MAKKPSGLGRGIDSIFLDNSVEAQNSVTTVRVSQIEARADQPRKSFESEALAQLADSIKAHGILQPILVRASGSGYYQIIAGERRFRASKLAGLSEIPAIILDKDDKNAAQIALIENIQREDLNPIEEALAYKSLAEEYDMTQEELSKQVGKSRSAIANIVRLLDLPDEVLTLVASKELSAGHARTLLGLNNRDDMILLAQHAVENDLSVRVLEEAVKHYNRPTKPVKEQDETPPLVDYFRELEIRVQSHLGRKVKIDGKGRNKTITLSYEDNEDLDEILTLLCGKEFLDQ